MAAGHKGDARYRRARRDLRDVLADLQALGTTLGKARYVRKGSLVEGALQVQAADVDVVTLAVLAERAAGASWGDIAKALREDVAFVREHYGPIEAQWRAGRGVRPEVDPPTTTSSLRVL